MLRAAPLVLLLSMPSASAAPVAASRPSDPDLRLGRSCAGHPEPARVVEAIPLRVPETTVLWPRVGTREIAGACETVARLTLVDHAGLLLTVSFVLRTTGDAPPQGFVPWSEEGGEESQGAERSGPPRSEWVWIPEGQPSAGPGLHVIVAGSPSGGPDSLEGATSFLGRQDSTAALAALLGER